MATELRLLFVTTNAGSASAVSMVVVFPVVLTSPRTTSPSDPARAASGRASALATLAATAPAAAPSTARRLGREVVTCSIVPSSSAAPRSSVQGTPSASYPGNLSAPDDGIPSERDRTDAPRP